MVIFLTIFIAITLHGIRAFLINFLVEEEEGWVSVGGQFLQIFRWKTWGATQNLSLWTVSPKGNWMEELVFCAVVIYLLVYYFFIYCLFVCLLFIYFYRAVCWVMHQLCGLVLLEGGKGVAISMELFGGFGGLALAYFVLQCAWCRMWWKACLHF